MLITLSYDKQLFTHSYTTSYLSLASIYSFFPSDMVIVEGKESGFVAPG